MHKQLNLKIKGRVQGVFYRVNTRQRALQLKLTGWVKNMPDGTVVCCAEGPEEVLRTFLEWHRAGPGSSAVQDVAVVWQDATGEFSTFDIKY